VSGRLAEGVTLVKKLTSLKFACVVSVFCAATAIASPAQIFTSLVSFDGADGSTPYASLVQGTDGNFYGTTYFGGNFNGVCYGSGCGTVFKMTPNGTLTTLHSFTDASDDGGNPHGALVQANDGYLYGTTNHSTFFKITSGGTFTYLSGGSSDTWNGVVLGGDGNFYGTSASGSTCDSGRVFKLYYQDGWQLASLHSFDGADGACPYAALVLARDGNFYGTTIYGGTNNNCSDGFGTGCGTVFRISAGGAFTNLHNFDGTDGAFPYAGLVQAADGNFYGTTSAGANNNCYEGCGTVFKITPGGVLTTLYSFTAAGDGGNPHGGLVQGTDGNFYGTTLGTVFEMTPGATLTTLHAFGGADGTQPWASLVQARDGIFYGTTTGGGAYSYGTVFSFDPPSDYGVSGGNARLLCGCEGGTLGSMVVKGQTQYVLSADHVLGLPLHSFFNGARVGDKITRPGLEDNDCKAAGIVASFTFAPTLNKGVDAAIATVQKGALSPTGEISQIGIPAGTIETASVGVPVAKNGRTTGLTCGQITHTNCDVAINYDCLFRFHVPFHNQIMMESEAGPFSCKGDSGSLIVDSSTAEPVGLLIGDNSGVGCSGQIVTIANPIGTVLQQLGGVAFPPNPTHAVKGCTDGNYIRVPSEQLSELERHRVLQAKEANSRRLLENPATLAMCSGATKDDPTKGELLILIRKGESADFIPRELNGVPTRIEYSEPFVAGNCPKTPSQPSTAGFNARSGTAFANGAIVPAGMIYGQVDAYANPARGNDPNDLTNLILDISSYFAP
jgi:uncharacterized repeat protein (TIGR03803 family)